MKKAPSSGGPACNYAVAAQFGFAELYFVGTAHVDVAEHCALFDVPVTDRHENAFTTRCPYTANRWAEALTALAKAAYPFTPVRRWYVVQVSVGARLHRGSLPGVRLHRDAAAAAVQSKATSRITAKPEPRP